MDLNSWLLSNGFDVNGVVGEGVHKLCDTLDDLFALQSSDFDSLVDDCGVKVGTRRRLEDKVNESRIEISICMCVNASIFLFLFPDQIKILILSFHHVITFFLLIFVFFSFVPTNISKTQSLYPFPILIRMGNLYRLVKMLA
jgi:hypothetical protein